MKRAESREEETYVNPDPKIEKGIQADESQEPEVPPSPRVRKGGALVEVRKLAVITKQGQTLLQDVSLHIQPGDFVAVTGAGSQGISALLEALAGIQPASDGNVLVDGVDLYPNRRVFRPRIGYAPPGHAVHANLTVSEALNTAARMRLPRGVQSAVRRQKVETVLAELGLTAQRDQRIGKISPADRQRVSLGLELVGDPRLLIIQEADGTNDPGDDARLAAMLRRQAEQGRTVICATRSPVVVEMADRVVILTRDGSLAWYGPPEEAVHYLGEFLPRSVSSGFAGLLAALDGSDDPSGKEWEKRFTDSPAYTKYIEGPLSGKQQDLLLEDQPLSRIRGRGADVLPPQAVPQISSLSELFLLIGRNLKLFFRDRTALFYAIVAPLILAGLEFGLASPKMYDPVAGDATRVVLVTALVVFLALLAAALGGMREISKESAVIRRERVNNLRIVPYVLSKVWLIVPVAIFQAFVWTAAHLVAAQPPAGIEAAPGFLITLALVAISGGVLGLLASALASAPQTAPLWVIALIIPQLIFGGALIPETRLDMVGKAAAAATPFRYGFAALITAGGHGADVASDPCWQLPDSERSALTDSQKQGCSCMGINIFSRCHLPGVWKDFAAILESPQPEAPKPDSGVNIPVQPVLRPGETLEEYAQAVNDYTLQLEIYQGSTDSFTGNLRRYAEDLAEWQRQRSLAIGAAEGRIAAEVGDYGPILQVDLLNQWLALAGISLLSMLILIGVLKRKGVRR